MSVFRADVETVAWRVTLPAWWPAGAVALILLGLVWSPASRVGVPAEGPILDAFIRAPLFLYTALACLLVGVVLTAWDRWLGALVVVVALSAIGVGTDLALATAHWITLGAVALALLRRHADTLRPWLVPALLASTLLEISYSAVQLVTQRDPLFFGWRAVHLLTPDGRPIHFIPIGSIGNPKYLGAMVAMVAPLAPWWLVPFFLPGIYLSESRLAGAALLVALLVKAARGEGRYHPVPDSPRRYRWVPTLVLLVCALSAVPLATRRAEVNPPAYAVLTAKLGLASAESRLMAWETAARHYARSCSWVFGCGVSGWRQHIAFVERDEQIAPQGVDYQAHSDLIGWLYEMGVPGAVLLAGLGRAWGRDLTRPAVVSLAVLAAGLHVFHVPTLAPTALLVLGCSTSLSSPSCS